MQLTAKVQRLVSWQTITIQPFCLVCILLTNIPLHAWDYTLQSHFSLVLSLRTLTGTSANPSECYLYIHNSLLVVLSSFPPSHYSVAVSFSPQLQESYLVTVVYRQNVWFKSKSKMVLKKYNKDAKINTSKSCFPRKQAAVSVCQLSFNFSWTELSPSATLPSLFE